MATKVVTSYQQTNFIPENKGYLECNLREETLHNREDKTSATNTVYETYVNALPKNDFIFLTSVRKWERKVGFVTPIRWTNAILIPIFHVIALISFFYTFCSGLKPMWKTILFGFLSGWVGGFGVTAGAHRYWTHRAFKAKLPLQIILMIAYSVAGQNSIPNWVRDHRVHHKMSETSADPHDANRGFFFSHVGWLMMKKHPDVIREGKKIDIIDVLEDPLVRFHTKYFIQFKILFCFVIPILIPVYLWNETWFISLTTVLVRYMSNLNCTWAVNSFAHIWGHKPYDINISPVENWKVSVIALGEGWHNYHHSFPWDYKAAELAYFINLTTVLIDIFSLIGWAYDLKTASPSLVKTVIRRRGPNKINFLPVLLHGTTPYNRATTLENKKIDSADTPAIKSH